MTHKKQLVESGIPVKQAGKAIIMLHGRGASARDILSLEDELHLGGYYVAAIQATNYSWYPFGFMAPVAQNEPWLSSAVNLVKNVTDDIVAAGIGSDKIYILGFSQGACLALEFSCRHARKWGGIIAFTGGLIGEVVNAEKYAGNFDNTPVFIGNSDIDPHVPLDRTKESKQIMETLGAKVTLSIYPNMGHTINSHEFEMANKLLTKSP